MPESAELVTPEDSVVVMIARPRSVSEVTEPEESPAEVEVVGKGKRKEEESEE